MVEKERTLISPDKFLKTWEKGLRPAETRHKVYNSGLLFQFCKFCTFLRCNKIS